MNKLLKEANQMLKFWCLDAEPDEVAKKREIARLSEFIKKHPVGSDNKLVSQSLKEAKEKLSKLVDTKDADPKIFQMIKELEDNIKEYKHDINYMKKHGQDASNLEKWLKEEETTLKAYKDIARLVPSKDASPFELRMIEKNERMLETARKDLEKAKQDYARHKDDPFWKELLIDAQNDVKRAEENLARAKRDVKDNDATENGSIKRYGQDEYKPDPKVIQILEDLRAHRLTPGAADKMLVQAGVPYVMAGLMVRKPEQYIPVNDEEPVYTLGDKDMKDEKTYQNGEHVKVKNHGTGEEIDLKVLKDNHDGTIEAKAPTGAVITVKKTWIVDSVTPLFRWKSKEDIGRKRLKEELEHLKQKKQTLERAISSQEHYYTNPTTKQDQQELAEIEMQISTVQHLLSKATQDECMEVLKLSGFATDAYDPKKYEGDFRHEWNERELQREVEHLKNNLALNKQRITTLRNMVNSHQYGDATLRELKQEERDYEANQMKMKQTLSMLQRIRGQKDEAPTMDAEPDSWTDVYDYFDDASLQELEKLQTRQDVINFLRRKGAFNKFSQKSIEEAVRRFMNS